jgi:hypothetical protein
MLSVDEALQDDCGEVDMCHVNICSKTSEHFDRGNKRASTLNYRLFLFRLVAHDQGG